MAEDPLCSVVLVLPGDMVPAPIPVGSPDSIPWDHTQTLKPHHSTPNPAGSSALQCEEGGN